MTPAHTGSVATFSTRDDLQIQILLIVVFVLIWATIIGRPFSSSTNVGLELARLELSSLSLLFVTLWSGLFFINFNCDNSPSCKMLSACVVFFNVLFLVYAVRRLFLYFEERTKVVAKTARFVRKLRAQKLFSLVHVDNPIGVELAVQPAAGGGGRGNDGEAEVEEVYDTQRVCLEENSTFKATEEEESRSEKRVESSEKVVDILVDQETGMRYSFDPATGETSWLDSEEEGESEKGQDDEDNNGGSDGAGAWERFLDEASGDYFECHTVTEEVRWVEDEADDDTETGPGGGGAGNIT